MLSAEPSRARLQPVCHPAAADGAGRESHACQHASHQPAGRPQAAACLATRRLALLGSRAPCQWAAAAARTQPHSTLWGSCTKLTAHQRLLHQMLAVVLPRVACHHGHAEHAQHCNHHVQPALQPQGGGKREPAEALYGSGSGAPHDFRATRQLRRRRVSAARTRSVPLSPATSPGAAHTVPPAARLGSAAPSPSPACRGQKVERRYRSCRRRTAQVPLAALSSHLASLHGMPNMARRCETRRSRPSARLAPFGA